MHIAGWEREDILKRMLEVVDGELDLLANVVQVTDWETVIKASGTLSVVPRILTVLSALQAGPGAGVERFYRAYSRGKSGR